jgi:hypothetical protein
MLKWLFLLHRWLGIVLGLVLVLWCLSGFVMMYKPYPELDEAAQLATLAPLDLSACCELPAEFAQAEARFDAATLRMLGTKPVLELVNTGGSRELLRLASGETLGHVDENEARALAAAFAAARGLGNPVAPEQIHNDQWTVYGAYNRHRPLYKFSASDAAGTQWYLSSRTGEIIQHTTREQRVWGWLGAVVHWLYPTLLRQHVALWANTVIWLTIAGVFLSVTGLYFGLRQYKTRKTGRKSPYRGLSAWHHYCGLLFGVLTLSWVFSGLFSMNPWGLLEGDGVDPELVRLRGGSMEGAEVAQVLQSLRAAELPQGTVAVELHELLGELQLVAVDAHAGRSRLDPLQLHPAPLAQDLPQRLAASLIPEGDTRVDLLQQDDAYYYSHHVQVPLPVWRIMRTDGSGSRYYLDPRDGRLLSKVDPAQRWNRWLFEGLHRLDFTALLRQRPLWDLLRPVAACRRDYGLECPAAPHPGAHYGQQHNDLFLCPRVHQGVLL